MKIAVIGCSKLKLRGEHKAQILYSKSSLFKKSLEYCKFKNFDKIVILSAKYGILNLDELIVDYNETIRDKSKQLLLEWATNTVNKLKTFHIKEVYFFCGSSYIKPISKMLINNNFIIYEPLKGLGIGKRLQFLTIK